MEEKTPVLGISEEEHEAIDGDYRDYYPHTDQERRDFFLARLVHEKYQEMFRVMDYQARKEYHLEKEELVQEVEALIVESKRNNEWCYDTSLDSGESSIDVLKQEIDDAEQDIVYIRKWIDQARNMIQTEKYTSVPASVFDQMKLDGERCGTCGEFDCVVPHEVYY